MKISFVIPVYKSYELLTRCINSIVSQVGNLDVEIIIVDDTPPVLSQSILEWAEKYSYIKIIRNSRNMGVTYSRNKGWFLACGDYVIFLDSDDLLIDGSLEIIFNDIIETNLDCYLFRTVNLNNKLVGMVLERQRFDSYFLLTDTYNTGERLLCIRKTNGKPFIGVFRGHEFAGLLRYISTIDHFKSIDAGYPARIYCNDNASSISNGCELRRRKQPLIKGHAYTAKKMFEFGHYYSAFLWLLRLIKAKYL
ncbi:glycosyltransferase [Shewanella sp. N2AIL]|uniref:glycosyltransferase family 2 protein n=1 Tax=Shewanella sp. N2AIL TaxID=2926851 RepID=UPI001F592884|nr:glycosyltransferase family 2 protein [Shewanella sp. N2AIL]MCI2962143.1 glycosyltransferase [Shewanella sp. N2AIL]